MEVQKLIQLVEEVQRYLVTMKKSRAIQIQMEKKLQSKLDDVNKVLNEIP